MELVVRVVVGVRNDQGWTTRVVVWVVACVVVRGQDDPGSIQPRSFQDCEVVFSNFGFIHGRNY